MMTKTKEDIYTSLEYHYKAACHLYPKENIIGIFARGSINYGLVYDNSDIDTICLVLPNFEDILNNQSGINKIEYLANEEHLELRDIRIFIQGLQYQNLAYIEILFTEYYIINSDYEHFWKQLQKRREMIAQINPNRLVENIQRDIVKDRGLLRARRPSVLFTMDRIGYDPKQLYHILRLYEFGERYMNGEEYAKCLYSNNTNELLHIKQLMQPIRPENEVVQLLDQKVNSFKTKVEQYKNNNKQNLNISIITINFLNEFKQNIVLTSLQRQITLLQESDPQ